LTNGQAVMHYSRHRLTASTTTWLRACTRLPMTNVFVLHAHWSVRQKLNCVSSVQLRRSVHAIQAAMWVPTVHLYIL